MKHGGWKGITLNKSIQKAMYKCADLQDCQALLQNQINGTVISI